MQPVEILRSLIDYHYAMFGRVWDSIMHLSDEQFVQEVAYSHGSLRNQVVHVAAVDTRWLMGLRELPDARAFHLIPADYPTRAAARAVWDGVARDVSQYVAELDEVDLARVPAGMRGPAWQVLVHLVNHGTDHRAQMLRILHDLGAPTFDQDFVLYRWSG